MPEPKAHWENIYKTKSAGQVSWYCPHLERSLEFINKAGLSKGSAIIDIGGGASTLADDLLGLGFKDLTALDISGEALKVARERLGKKAQQVHWLEASVLDAALEPARYDLWHDRAVFHFLIDAGNRKKYVEQLKRSLKAGGHAVLATFSLKGPLKCSGLEIVRYGPESLAAELGKGFELIESLEEEHRTPFGTSQAFLYCLFKRSN